MSDVRPTGDSPELLQWVIPEPAGGPGSLPPPPRPPSRGRWGPALRWAAVIALVALVSGVVGGRLGRSVRSPASVVTPEAIRPGPAATPGDEPSGSPADAPPPSEVSSIAAKVNPAVVDISTEVGFGDGEAAGTGMVLTSSGEVLTNNHVVEGATAISATVVGTGKTYAAHVVGTDPADDVAVLQLEGASKLPTITVAKSAAAVGDPVVATGNARGRGGAPSVVSGTVVALGQTITVSDGRGGDAESLDGLIEVDAPLQPGDSGGPLVNRSGEVIGMDTAAEVRGFRFRSTTTAGFAIPIGDALSIAADIRANKASATVHIGLPAFLGVQLAPTGATGAVVAGVEPGTPAASVGLSAGDRVTSVDGATVDSSAALASLLRAHRPGDRVTVEWTDGAGEHHRAVATLAAGPAD